jgi:hypothetical protein
MILDNKAALPNLANSFNNKDSFPDFVIDVHGQGSKLVHKHMLSINSAYFKARCNFSDHLTIDKTDDAEHFIEMIKSLYTGKLNVTNVAVMLALSKKYKVASVERALLDYLQYHINRDNFFEVLNFIDHPEILRAVEKFCGKVDVNYIFNSEKLLQLSSEAFKQVMMIITKQQSSSKGKAFDVVKQWIASDIEKRTRHEDELARIFE